MCPQPDSIGLQVAVLIYTREQTESESIGRSSWTVDHQWQNVKYYETNEFTSLQGPLRILKYAAHFRKNMEIFDHVVCPPLNGVQLYAKTQKYRASISHSFILSLTMDFGRDHRYKLQSKWRVSKTMPQLIRPPKYNSHPQPSRPFEINKPRPSTVQIRISPTAIAHRSGKGGTITTLS